MDDAELDALCQSQWPRLVGMLRLYTGDRNVAEDLAQETLARLCRDWSKVSRLETPAAWVTRVAMNLARSHFRRVAVRRRFDASPKPPVPATVSPDVDNALAVRTAIVQLPPRQRAVLLARYFLDLSVRETAEALRCSEGTVKSSTSDAIANLRRSGLLNDAPEDERLAEGACDVG